MNLLSERTWYTDKSSIGSLSIENIYECLTLEDTDRFLEKGGLKIPKRTAIPRGRYRIIVDWSERFQRPMPHILDVPQFTGIRFHILNTADETEGCIGVAQKRGIDVIYGSAPAFNVLFKKIFNAWTNGEEIWIEVS